MGGLRGQSQSLFAPVVASTILQCGPKSSQRLRTVFPVKGVVWSHVEMGDCDDPKQVAAYRNRWPRSAEIEWRIACFGRGHFFVSADRDHKNCDPSLHHKVMTFDFSVGFAPIRRV